MRRIDTGDTTLVIKEDGPPEGAPLLLLGPLATSLGVWDRLVSHLPDEIRVLRMDPRGHGASDCPDGPYRMGALVRDTETVMEAARMTGAVVVGCGLGGVVAQGLAVKRLDLVRGLVLMGSAARLGHADHWHDLAADLRRGGMRVFVEGPLQKWGRRLPEGLRDTIADQSPEGIAATCEALAGTDFYTPTSGLRLPCLGLGGTEDRFVPPDLTRETVGLIPGSEMRLLRRAGHAAMLDTPKALAVEIVGFLDRIGHAGPSALGKPGAPG